MLGDRRRVVIEAVRPAVDGGMLPAKATQGLPLHVSATLVADGHDPLLGWVRFGPGTPAAVDVAGLPNGWEEVALEPAGNDRYTAWVAPGSVGEWSFAVVAMPDEYGAWVRDLRIRFQAGQDIGVELEEGLAIVRRRLRTAAGRDRTALTAVARALE
ncbi:MAG TPA: maltotransferase domain-containing protein, partial [Dehalococcoidia bacterium]|nr:maltotransferase domain-containing protein [Dehalococcoidia bacterium]